MTYEEAAASVDGKIVVLDDDPTGVQCVHGVHVYTEYGVESIRQGFAEEHKLFFLLTNSRAFSPEKTREAHGQIARDLARVSKETGRGFILISRGDSTLRGHYPLETETLRAGLEAEGLPVDGEILCPFFAEGGRFTCGNVHYVQQQGELVPVGQTEFARDPTFGFSSSNLVDWVAEKTKGAYRDTQGVSLEELREGDYRGIRAKLLGLSQFRKFIVNAMTEEDLRAFVIALAPVLARRRFLFRTAAAFPKVLAGIPARPLLDPQALMGPGKGGLVVVGSHVAKTTEQLERLRALPGLVPVEMDQHRAADPDKFLAEQRRVAALAEDALAQGATAVLFTRRQRLDLPDPQAALALAVTISDGVSKVVGSLQTQPRFLIAKGGITASDVGTKALGVARALVLGQAAPGVPVWRTGPEAKFPGLPYIIFPGNVGAPETLADLVSALRPFLKTELNNPLKGANPCIP